MTRDQLRAQIDTLEALGDVQAAIEDLRHFEAKALDFRVSDHADKAPIAFAHSLPQSVVLAGLEAMKTALDQMLVREPA